jgi:stress-induced morphogen
MKYKLTSVKLLEDLYKRFKYNVVSDEFTLQKLVNRSMDLYLMDNEFKTQIHDWENLKPSGSRL